MPIHEKYGLVVKDDDSIEFIKSNIGLISAGTVNRLKLLSLVEDIDVAVLTCVIGCRHLYS